MGCVVAADYDEGLWARLVTEFAGRDMGPDFSGVIANANLEVHMRECAIRHAELRAEIRALSNRQWATAIGVILLLITVVGFLIPFYIGR